MENSSLATILHLLDSLSQEELLLIHKQVEARVLISAKVPVAVKEKAPAWLSKDNKRVFNIVLKKIADRGIAARYEKLDKEDIQDQMFDAVWDFVARVSPGSQIKEDDWIAALVATAVEYVIANGYKEEKGAIFHIMPYIRRLAWTPKTIYESFPGYAESGMLAVAMFGVQLRDMELKE